MAPLVLVLTIKKASVCERARLHRNGMLAFPAQILTVFRGIKPAGVVIAIRQAELVQAGDLLNAQLLSRMGKAHCIFSFCAAYLVDTKPEGFWLKTGDQGVANPRRRCFGLRWMLNPIHVARGPANRGKRIMSADFRLARFHEMVEG